MLFNPWFAFNPWLNLFRRMLFTPWIVPLQAAQVAWGAQSRIAGDLMRPSQGIAPRSQPPAEAIERSAEIIPSPSAAVGGAPSAPSHRAARRHRPTLRNRDGNATTSRTTPRASVVKSKHKKRRAVRRMR
jgi:hypothetical protein